MSFIKNNFFIIKYIINLYDNNKIFCFIFSTISNIYLGNISTSIVNYYEVL